MIEPSKSNQFLLHPSLKISNYKSSSFSHNKNKNLRSEITNNCHEQYFQFVISNLLFTKKKFKLHNDFNKEGTSKLLEEKDKALQKMHLSDFINDDENNKHNKRHHKKCHHKKRKNVNNFDDIKKDIFNLNVSIIKKEESISPVITKLDTFNSFFCKNK